MGISFLKGYAAVCLEGAIIDAGRSILDASARDPFVLADTCRFGRALRLFRKIDVLDTQEPKVCIIVKCFSADDLLPGKESILQGTVDTDIQRPSVLKKVFFYIFRCITDS